jgi:hypothetical protein
MLFHVTWFGKHMFSRWKENGNPNRFYRYPPSEYQQVYNVNILFKTENLIQTVVPVVHTHTVRLFKFLNMIRHCHIVALDFENETISPRSKQTKTCKILTMIFRPQYQSQFDDRVKHDVLRHYLHKEIGETQ